MPRKKTGPQGAGTEHLRVIKDHDHRVSPGHVLAFRAGTEVHVLKHVAKALKDAGVAEPIPDETNPTPMNEA